MEDQFQLRTLEFVAPSGNSYIIREQNGEDDDIISNPITSRDLSNLSELISSLVVSSTISKSGKLTQEMALNLPSNDRYCILLKSRMFSLGETIEFEYDWGKENGGKTTYEQDLNEFIFNYETIPSVEEVNKKPDAIPFYSTLGITGFKDIPVVLPSGKEVMFDLLTGKGETYILNLPLSEKTKNKELMARNLRLNVEGKWEKVEKFSIFSSKDMIHLRRTVAEADPLFTGNTTLVNPNNESQSTMINIFSIPGFFFPGE